MTSRQPPPNDSATQATGSEPVRREGTSEHSESTPGAHPTLQNAPPSRASGTSSSATELTLITQNPTDDVVQAQLQSLGRYSIESQIGRGGFGAVFAAHDPVLDRKVAIKVPRALATAAQAAAFLSEARRLAQLRHPGIVAVHDLGEQQGLCYIVTEFLEGQTLSRLLDEQSLPWRDAVALVAQIADALAHAHSLSIIHRDVKPANIFITQDGRPVLLDFGLALTDDDTAQSLDAIVGTPTYMSPEQARGEGHRVDGRTDIYSLGAVLYRVLCARPPFRASETHELVRKIIEDEPQPPRQLNRDIPPQLEQICLQALAKKQTQRFTTAGDFANALRSILTSEGSTAPHSSGSGSGIALAPSGLGTRPDSHRSTTRRRRVPERRRVTLVALSLELLPLTEGKSFDAERQHELLQDFEAWCRECVARHDGTVFAVTGQTLTACFGFPRAHEDAAHRAVHTALELLEWTSDWSERAARPRRCSAITWAAVHTGEVVAEEVGPESDASINLVGDATTIVTRLEQQTAPGTVTISEATSRLVTGHFELKSLGTQRLRGVAQPVRLFEATRAIPSRSRVDLIDPANLTPLVGRDTELGILRDRWELAVEEQGQVVLLIGDAGLGKSRLIRELREYVGQQTTCNPLVIEFRGSAYHQNTGFFPAIEYLSRLFGFDESGTNSDRLDRVARYLQDLELGSDENVALLASLLSLPTDGRYPPLALAPQRQKDLTQDLLLQCLQQRARQTPVLFIVEDLHWIDPSTLELLGRHVAEFERSRLLSVLTFRPEFQTPWHSYPHQTQIALNRLTRRQIGDMMRRKTGRQEIPDAILNQIAERTDGVPLFIEEFTNLIAESGILDQPTGSGETGVLAAIPASLKDLLVARLDRMASNPEVAQLAATIGREFSYAVLSAASQLAEPELQAELDKLVRAELLFQKGRYPEANFIFKHALIQDSAYQSMLKKTRREFHRRIAEALETRFPETAVRQPELLARHFTEADLPERSIDYWRQAGLLAQGQFANLEAIQHFRRGLSAVAAIPESPHRDQRELDLQIPLSTVITMAHGWGSPDVEQVHLRSRELCRRIGNEAPLFHVTWGQWAWHLLRAELDRADELCRSLWELTEGRDPGYLMEGCFGHTCTGLFRGEFPRSMEYGFRGLELYDEARCRFHSRITSQNAGCTTRAHLAWSVCIAGHLEQAQQIGEAGVQLGQQLKEPFSEAFSRYHLACVQYLCGLGQATRHSSESAIAIGKEQGFGIWVALGTLGSGSGLILEGRDIARGVERIQQGISAFRASGAELSLSHYFAVQAEAYQASGRLDEALAVVNEGIAFAERTNERFCLANLLRLLGDLHLQRSTDNAPQAEQLYLQALTMAGNQQARTWELLAATSLARLWKGQGRTEAARQVLAPVYEWFREGLELRPLRAARSLLTELENPAR